MRFVLAGLFIVFIVGLVIGIIAKTFGFAKSIFIDKTDDEKENYFKNFINNYFKNKNTSNENNQILQLMARDLIKSKNYQDLENNYKIKTLLLSIVYLTVSAFIMFLLHESIERNAEVLMTFVGFISLFFGIYLLRKRNNKKDFILFEKIPLNQKQVEKLKLLKVNNNVKEYIEEKSKFEHAFNGGDLIFMSKLIN